MEDCAAGVVLNWRGNLRVLSDIKAGYRTNLTTDHFRNFERTENESAIAKVRTRGHRAMIEPVYSQLPRPISCGPVQVEGKGKMEVMVKNSLWAANSSNAFYKSEKKIIRQSYGIGARGCQYQSE